MARLRLRSAVSLDGYSAGPNQSVEHPLGEMEGGTTFYFVTDGIESALEQAREAAKGQNVLLAGGANVAQQYFRAGLVDEIILSIAPVILGGGERLFDDIGDGFNGMELVEIIPAPGVVHLWFSRP